MDERRQSASPTTGPPGPAAGHVLVVGATRVLRPAVGTLAARGASVTAVARTAGELDALARESPGDVRPLAADATADDFGARLRRAGGPAGFTGALVYAPALPPRAVTGQVAASLDAGPLVLILTSEWAAPGNGAPASAAWAPHLLPAGARPGDACRPLVLGWRGTGPAVRWHTPEEISAAALALLDDPRGTDAVLGEVRPWTARPS
ncbi:hypothetical protein AB0J21_04120 [Streptomyces sp. NPDC049954]|uniref:hypothetical protein n=1 Tax=Streptomyces sp. NPDC049954 TaxID=3155779 RepID=UPI00344007E8